jgi:tetratricopeptide (TPR) repeat protein
MPKQTEDQQRPARAVTTPEHRRRSSTRRIHEDPSWDSGRPRNRAYPPVSDRSPIARSPRRLSRRLAWALGIGALGALLVSGGLLLRSRARPAAPPAGPVTGQPDPTEARLQRAVEAHPNSAAARVELGKYYEGVKRPFSAMWEYAEARQVAPTDADLPLRLAAVLRDGELPDQAEPQLVRALQARPDDLRVPQALAELYLSMGQPERARALLEERQQAIWQDVVALVGLGRMRQASGGDEGAIAAFRRAIALEPLAHEAWYRLGRLYLRRGQNAMARDAFSHALAAGRSRPEYPLYLGMAYLQQDGPGDPERALLFLKLALSLRANFATAHFQSGLALQRMKREKEGLTQFSLAVLADPSYPEPNLALARGLTAEGNLRDAHRYMGRYYELKDRPADAVREFQAIADASPESVQPALIEGQVYVRTQQNAKAVAVTEAALKRHPDSVSLLERLAVLKTTRGDFQAARGLLRRWLQLNPRAASPLWLLGRCDLGELKYADAVAKMEKAVARQPNNPHYLAFLGAGLISLNTTESRERAAQVLAKAAGLAPSDGDYLDLYGQALQQLGRYEQARQQYLRALDANPSRLATYTPLSEVAWRLQRPGPAAIWPPVIRSVQQRLGAERLLWTHVWQHPEDAGGRLKLARFFCRTAHLTRARDQLEQLLAQKPDWVPARQLMATVERALEVQ